MAHCSMNCSRTGVTPPKTGRNKIGSAWIASVNFSECRFFGGGASGKFEVTFFSCLITTTWIDVAPPAGESVPQDCRHVHRSRLSIRSVLTSGSQTRLLL